MRQKSSEKTTLTRRPGRAEITDAMGVNQSETIMKTMKLFPGAATLITVFILCLAGRMPAQSPGFGPSLISNNGLLAVQAMDTFYDGANGTRFVAVALPTNISRMQFRVTGGVITDSSSRYASADGLYANGQTPYNFSGTLWSGTCQGTPVGSTTGIDPAVFGVFFNPAFSGTASNSLNYRSDSGIIPDPRSLLLYEPSLNQPFYIGDGYDSNNAFASNIESYIPPGTNQTYVIPSGATHLLLGISADINMDDNRNASDTNSAFLVHVFDDRQSAPVISSIVSPGPVLFQGAACAFKTMLASGSSPLTCRWSLNGAALSDGGRISGSAGLLLNIDGVMPEDSGTYCVVVSNSLGQASATVRLDVFPAGQVVITNISIPGKAEIHGAGNAGLPDAGGGVAPVLVNLPVNAMIVTLSNVSDTITLNGGGGRNNADGVVVSGGGYPAWSYASAFGGISGIKTPGAGSLVGVFEPTNGPVVSPPAELDFTVIGTNFTSLAPTLFQTFYLGDGRVANGAGAVQTFYVPQGATRLFLGVHDAGSFNGSPGGYGDNSGSFSASVLVTVPFPQITALMVTTTNFGFSFQTVVGQNYTIQQRTNLLLGAWEDYTNFTGNGLVEQWSVPVTGDGSMYLRLRVP